MSTGVSKIITVTVRQL